jgi:hypothetical protein
VWPYPNFLREEKLLGEERQVPYTDVNYSKRLMKIMRCEDSLLKTEHLHKGNTGKTGFEKDTDTSGKDVSAEDSITSRKNDSRL